MSIVIIGGGGFLGAHLVSELQRNLVKSKLIIIDPHPRLTSFEKIEISEENITYVKESFLNTTVLDKFLPGADVVFHLCAIGHTGVYGSRKLKEHVYHVNVFGTKQLVEKCKKYKVKRFIYSSSVAVVFTGKPIYNVTEDDPLPHPSEYIDTYSATKAAAESFVLSQSTPLFKTSCLRFRAIYGPQDVSVAEKVVKMVQLGLLMVRISRHGREAISNMSAGENCASALYLADKALQKKDGPHGRAYFITDGETIGQYTVWNPLIKALGKKPSQSSLSYFLASAFVTLSTFICYELLNVGPPMSRFELEILVNDNTYSIRRAQEELGFQPQKQLFAKTVEYYKCNTEKNAAQICLDQSIPLLKQFILVFFILFTIVLFFQ